ncbi:hypothetical protein [Helicobacter trogontum]|uniref:hypothetical protein n=1 Tax=Helicobacter trogontum TaxID=50960 RepID=UPI00051CF5F8|nr:hypothetical protein [Helicobacter trogontum]
MTKIVFIVLSIALLTQKLSAKSSQKAHVKLLESKQDSKLHAKDSQIKSSFDCIKATTKVEKIICNDESGELQKLDRLYSKLYFSILKSIPKDTKQGQKIRKQQKRLINS